MQTHDFVIAGGGMAGVCLAAELAGRGSTLLLERETALGTHATSRSAALYYRNYGERALRALSRASERFFRAPPEAFAAAPVARPTGVLTLASPGDEARLEAYRMEPVRARTAEPIPVAEARRRVPVLRPEGVAAALWEADAADLDVDLLLQGFRRTARAAGAELRTGAELLAARRSGSGWELDTSSGALRAGVIINAGGAWADVIAARCGIAPIGFAPKRRTALRVPAPVGQSVQEWPMVIDARERYYFKPDAGALLLSLAEETDSEPCDAWARDEDVALAVDRVQQVADIPVEKLLASWAGLRTFSPDRDVVIGFDPAEPRFFWLAGQGGTGIQSAPAAARAACALLAGEPLPAELLDHGVVAAEFDPARFQRRT